MEKIKVIIDTDVGDDIDDAFALCHALGSPELDILGVTTVYKNSHQRAQIAASILQAGQRNIPVYAGKNDPEREGVKPFAYERIDEDGTVHLRHLLPAMRAITYESKDAVSFLLDTADEYPNEVVLLGIGPLTNLAEAIKTRPESFKKFKKVILMNGFFGANYPEWNVMCDPEATRAVYTCGVPVQTVGANCTLRTEIFEENLKRIRALKGDLGKLLNDMLTVWFGDNNRNCMMHDSLALSCLYANFVTFQKGKIFVPLEDGARGYTLAVDGESPAFGEVEYSVDADISAFLEDFFERVERVTNG